MRDGWLDSAWALEGCSRSWNRSGGRDGGREDNRDEWRSRRWEEILRFHSRWNLWLLGGDVALQFVVECGEDVRSGCGGEHRGMA